jgi:predicted DsbA family dithiol-disulfide isomerase
MKIDFVSDVACPWCAVGLHALEEALRRVGPDVPVQLHFQPFELNPDMAPQGEDTIAYLSKKYGASPEQLARTQEVLRARGAAVGFTFGSRPRVWNTFDAHRLLHWAGLQDAARVATPGAGPGGNPPGYQRALKHALLVAYHTHAENPGAQDVLLRLAGEVGLDVAQAREVLDSGAYAAEVRERERFYQQQGINSVPSIIIDDQHLIEGGQPSEVFEQALRQLSLQA